VAIVRCPKCGAVTPGGHHQGERCHACHEALTKCRYCRFYDARALDCMHESRATEDHVSDADEVLNCPMFSSRLPGLEARRHWYALSRTSIITIVLTLAVAMAVLNSMRRPAPTAALPLSVSMSAQETVVQDDGLEVAISVVNTGEEMAKGVEIGFTGRGMGGLECQSVTPQECFVAATPHSVRLSLGDVPPGEMRQASVHFACKRTGKLTLAASATMANSTASQVMTFDGEVIP
jgi:hypothetical protein